MFNAEDRFWTQYQVDRDADAYAALWAAFVRAAIFPTLCTALAEGRNDSRSPEFFDRLESGIVGRLAAEPEQMQIPFEIGADQTAEDQMTHSKPVDKAQLHAVPGLTASSPRRTQLRLAR